MTRSYTFTLTSVGKAYNLWTDLILPTLIDPQFSSNTPYVPSNVQELTIQNQTGASALTWGTMILSTAAGSIYTKRASVNSIDLKKETLNPGANPMTVVVSIIAN